MELTNLKIYLADFGKQVTDSYRDKIIKNNDYTTIIRQQCGKNRLAVVSKIIDFNIEEITTP